MREMKRSVPILCILMLVLAHAAYAGGTSDSSAASASGYPKGPITITCPPAAGGGTDLLLRALAPVLRENLGQNVLVVNKPGGGGAIGFSAAAKDKPDGYNIVALVAEVLGVTHVAEVDFSFRDFEIINMINATYGTLTVNAKAPYNTLQEFLDYAKKNPGTVRFSNSGVGGPWHILAAAFASQAGIDIIHTPFDGGGPSAIAVAGGHVEATTASAQENEVHIRAGNSKLLAIFAPKRDPRFPDVPTGAEAGFEGQLITVFRGFGAPKGTPPEIIKILDEAIKKTLDDPRIVDFMAKQGFTKNYLSGPDFYALLEREDEIFRVQSKALGLGAK
jgi:tripartite-type tricarboxylate transporter receptor subunit TctC